MDVQVDGDFIRLEREKRAWSQEHLAAAAGIGGRTVQRIEATGVASYESVRAISAALEIPVSNLRREDGARQQTPSPVPASLPVAGGPAVFRVPLPRFVPWLGVAAVLALVAGASGFLLLKDYQKVRVLRTVEQWVTDAQPSIGAANRSMPDAL